MELGVGLEEQVQRQPLPPPQSAKKEQITGVLVAILVNVTTAEPGTTAALRPDTESESDPNSGAPVTVSDVQETDALLIDGDEAVEDDSDDSQRSIALRSNEPLQPQR